MLKTLIVVIVCVAKDCVCDRQRLELFGASSDED
jgi:hypothetical protein